MLRIGKEEVDGDEMMGTWCLQMQKREESHDKSCMEEEKKRRRFFPIEVSNDQRR